MAKSGRSQQKRMGGARVPDPPKYRHPGAISRRRQHLPPSYSLASVSGGRCRRIPYRWAFMIAGISSGISRANKPNVPYFCANRLPASACI
jgi:hypothetical protein